MYFQGPPVEQCQPRAVRHDRQEAPQDESEVTVPGVHSDPTQDLTTFDQLWQTTADQPWSEDTVWSSMIPQIDLTHTVDRGFYSLPGGGHPSSTFEHPAITPAPSYQTHQALPSEQVVMPTFKNVPTSSPPGLWSEMTAEQRSNVEWYARQLENSDGPKAGSSRPSNRAKEGSSPRER
jgi:hypothetical protein